MKLKLLEIMKRIEKKVVIVTGGAKVIGRETCTSKFYLDTFGGRFRQRQTRIL